MSMLSSIKANKADANQLVKQSAQVADTTSAEGSLLEEFSQILDKIADQLARGHKDTETIDLLAIEQAVERVQSQVVPPAQRPEVREVSAENDDTDRSIDSDESGDQQGFAEQGDASALTVGDAAGEELAQTALQGGTNSEGEDLSSFEQEVVDRQGAEESLDDVPETVIEKATESSVVVEGSIEGSAASESKSESVEVNAPVDVEAPVVSEQPSLSTSAAARSAAGARSESAASSSVDAMTSANHVSHVDRPVTNSQSPTSVSTSSATLRSGQELFPRAENLSSGVNGSSTTTEKAVPFTTFMLQGNGFAGSGISRDVVAQAILRPSLDSAVTRQVSEVAASSGKGGAQSGFGSDTSMLRGGATQVKNDSTTRALKALPRAIAARTLEKVERALEEVARSKDGKTISLHLEPVTLGKVKVDVSLRDGNLHARLSAEAGEVQQLLREHAHELQAILRKAGLHVDSVSVSVGSENSTFENTADLYGRESFSERSRSEGETGDFSTPPDVAESGRPAVADDHWVA